MVIKWWQRNCLLFNRRAEMNEQSLIPGDTTSNGAKEKHATYTGLNTAWTVSSTWSHPTNKQHLKVTPAPWRHFPWHLYWQPGVNEIASSMVRHAAHKSIKKRVIHSPKTSGNRTSLTIVTMAVTLCVTAVFLWKKNPLVVNFFRVDSKRSESRDGFSSAVKIPAVKSSWCFTLHTCIYLNAHRYNIYVYWH